MGHHACLWSGERAEPCLETPDLSPELHLRAKYRVPVFWLGLFSIDDFRPFHASGEEEEWPYLIASREAALTRLMDRQDRMFAILPERHLPTFEAFCTVLRALRQSYLYCDFSDVGMMVEPDPAKWETSLRHMIEALDVAPPQKLRTGLRAVLLGSGLPWGWEQILLSNGLDLNTAKPDDAYSLAGGYFGDMPWEKDPDGGGAQALP